MPPPALVLTVDVVMLYESPALGPAAPLAPGCVGGVLCGVRRGRGFGQRVLLRAQPGVTALGTQENPCFPTPGAFSWLVWEAAHMPMNLGQVVPGIALS